MSNACRPTQPSPALGIYLSVRERGKCVCSYDSLGQLSILKGETLSKLGKRVMGVKNGCNNIFNMGLSLDWILLRPENVF